LKTDNWFYGLFQSAPDLIALLLPMPGAVVSSLEPDAPGDVLYRFEAPELKAANHRLDGAFWPRNGEAGTAEQPVVLPPGRSELSLSSAQSPGDASGSGCGGATPPPKAWP
jgi:hypothetical protein